MRTFNTCLVLLLLWQITAAIIGNDLIFPGVIKVAGALISLTNDTKVLESLIDTVVFLGMSWILISVVVVVVMLAAGAWPVFGRFFKDLCMALQPTPTFAWLPVFMLVFGVNEVSLMLMLIFSGLWMIGYNSVTALEVSKLKWQPQCRNLSLGMVRSLWLVYLPSMQAIMMANAKTAWNMSWRTLLALEVVFGSIGDHWGIGTFMVTAKDNMLIEEMYAILFVIITVGLLFNLILDWLQDKSTRKFT